MFLKRSLNIHKTSEKFWHDTWYFWTSKIKQREIYNSQCFNDIIFINQSDPEKKHPKQFCLTNIETSHNDCPSKKEYREAKCQRLLLKAIFMRKKFENIVLLLFQAHFGTTDRPYISHKNTSTPWRHKRPVVSAVMTCRNLPIQKESFFSFVLYVKPKLLILEKTSSYVCTRTSLMPLWFIWCYLLNSQGLTVWCAPWRLPHHRASSVLLQMAKSF